MKTPRRRPVACAIADQDAPCAGFERTADGELRPKALAIWNHRVALAVSEGGHNNLGSGAHHIWAGLDLFAVFGQQNCYDRAVQKIDEMTNGAISQSRRL